MSCNNAYWVSASHGSVPTNAVVGGSDIRGCLYIARAHHQGALTPGKLYPAHGVCYISWGAHEHKKTSYEVLCGGNGRFVSSSGGRVPCNAVRGGRTESGECLYIGRVRYDNTMTIGKIQPSHGVCYIPYDGKELAFSSYEVYVE